ncbi:hypothetical protein [Streptomyces sp. NPDC018045]|uniref:hypothetical protein n=1 Tax=Streptomyces sp. NPDC018045 TaxID=3365037 RepID=UPI003789F2AE
MWAVYDLCAGQVEARMVCGYDVPGNTTPDRDHPVVTSPGARYLAAGPPAFALKRQPGICLQGDGNRKTLFVASILLARRPPGTVAVLRPIAQGPPGPRV